MNLQRRIGMIALAMLIVLFIAYGFMPKPVTVDIVEVSRGKLQVTVEEEGKTRVIDRYVIYAPVSGYARRIELDVGDAVAHGEVLMALDPLRSTVLDPRSRAEAEARVGAAESRLKSAQQDVSATTADANFANKELKRFREIFKDGAVSRETLDQAETTARRARAALRSAEFAVDVAQHELEAAQTALRYSAAENPGQSGERVAISSPVSGQVLKVYRESEGVSNAGDPLIEVGNSRALEIEIDVLSSDAVRIQPGMRVVFDRWGGEHTLEGEVRTVEPAGFTKISALGVEEQRVLVIADIISSPGVWQKLGDGYRVEASFILWESDDVLQIPASALFRHGNNSWAVFVNAKGKAELRSVELGQRSGLHAQVVKGLEEGEHVISHPDKAIEDSTRIKQRD